MRLIIALTALLAFPCFAGYIETNVRVCGVTTPYLRYDLKAPALTGSSSLGHREEFFRISEVLNVKSRLDASGLKTSAVINDLRVALHIEGIQLCITGDLYAAESKTNPNKSILTLYPKTFEFEQTDEALLNPSELAGIYVLKNSRHKYSLVAVRDIELGERFRLSNFFKFLNHQSRKKNAAPCYKLAGPDLSIAVHRTGRTTLVGELELQCDPTDKNDRLKLTFTFSPKRLVIETERLTKIQQYSLNLDGRSTSR